MPRFTLNAETVAELVEVLIDLDFGNAAGADRVALLAKLRKLSASFRDVVDAAVASFGAARRLAAAPSMVEAPLAVAGAPGLALPCGSVQEIGTGLGLLCAFCADAHPLHFVKKPAPFASGWCVGFGCCAPCRQRLVFVCRLGEVDSPATLSSGDCFGFLKPGERRGDGGQFHSSYMFDSFACLKGPSVPSVFVSESESYKLRLLEDTVARSREVVELALVWEAATQDVFVDGVAPCLEPFAVYTKLVQEAEQRAERECSRSDTAVEQALITAESVHFELWEKMFRKTFPTLLGADYAVEVLVYDRGNVSDSEWLRLRESSRDAVVQSSPHFRALCNSQARCTP